MQQLPSVTMKKTTSVLVLGWSLLACTPARTDATGARPRPLQVLWVAGGVYHDFDALVPELTSHLRLRVNATFDAKFELEVWRDEKFADGYDAVVYQFCRDDAEDVLIDHALQATRSGKPTVILHCGVHSFRHSDRVGEWEACCGMRSKVHDPYQPFHTLKLDPVHPVTRAWPEDWATAGDELYQTIELLPGSHALLEVKSPQDGREHVVSWTSSYGKGRVFATTLGHDLKTASTPPYHRLLADGLLWACGKLGDDGEPAPGYGASARDETK
jgi:type 1 glutamine amidotransferase